ncbi:hypothetical protein [Cryobacterium sp. PAMC25264]|uniref:hypothetical protein n=1 Tax=Cryobacterium sp. PAMC25264 TaxID=2861288 RepID=UPI001C62D722|nr:hypothetical protein [Cryobacterium sp. PAMC25264]QYF74547.1 hypothetical protein KY500_04990 [Cryobacterium sp. PAMC25264]
MTKPIVFVVLLVLLTGCTAGGDSASPSPTATGSPTAAAGSTASPPTASPPTAAQVTWAGTVCGDITTLKTDVQGLAAAAATGGDSVGTAISKQMDTVSASATDLVDTVKSPPENLGDDPELLAVQDSIDNVDQSLKTLEASASQVQGTTGAALVDALATVVGDTGDALNSVAGTVQTVTTAINDTSSTLGQAFRAAPECADLTS